MLMSERSFFAFSFSASASCRANFAVPEPAMVPRLATSSSRLMPMPLSVTVISDFLSSSETVIARSGSSRISESSSWAS